MCGTEGSKFEQYFFSFATISSTTKQTKINTGRTLCPNLNLSFPIELLVINQNFPFQSNSLFLIKLIVSSRTRRPPIEHVISSRTCCPSRTCPPQLNFCSQLSLFFPIELVVSSRTWTLFELNAQNVSSAKSGIFLFDKTPTTFSAQLGFQTFARASQKKQKERWNSQITKQKGEQDF